MADKAEVLIADGDNIILSRNKLGSGYVYFLNCALENTYTQLYNAPDSDLCEVYRYVFDLSNKPIVLASKKCSVTYHTKDDKILALITNFGDVDEVAFKLNDGYVIADNKYCTINEQAIKLSKNYCWLLLDSKRN